MEQETCEERSRLSTNIPLPSNIIATTALHHYFQVLPQKGKPTPGKEWTVYAAIVATKNRISTPTRSSIRIKTQGQEMDPTKENLLDAWVVTCATGSKCTALQPALSHFSKIVGLSPCVSSQQSQPQPNIQLNRQSNAQQQQCNYLCREQLKGMVLHDSHAEVLARRGLIKVLLKEIRNDLNNFEKKKPTSDITSTSTSTSTSTATNAHACLTSNPARPTRSLLQRVCSSSNKIDPNEIAYELNSDILLHLYISDSPCGDASIYDIAPKYNAFKGNSNECSNFTGAKIITSSLVGNGLIDESHNLTPCGEKNNGNTHDNADATYDTNNDSSTTKNEQAPNNSSISIAREKTQITSALRLKSGRSNLPSHLRSVSMSCSDKICKWMVLGLQGHGILNYFLSKPIMLSSVVVSHDIRAKASSQKEALERALLQRAQQTLESISDDDVNVGNDVSSNTSLHRMEMNQLPLLPLPVELQICQEIFPQSKAEAEKEAHCLSLEKSDAIAIAIAIEPLSSSLKKRKRSDGKDLRENIPSKKTRLSPIGISINWQTSICQENTGSYHERGDEKNMIEQTVGAKGIKQGKTPKRLGDAIKCASRLSRHVLFRDSIECVKILQKNGMVTKDLTPAIIINLIGRKTPTNADIGADAETQLHGHVHDSNSYQMYKNGKETKSFLYEKVACPLAGWVRSSNDHDFFVCNST